ncbi:hypothetical protein L596_010069 [Steinernema carpocapsae]|uniref:Uncharacterized protein n=1 Tax=Steinernema carpocapsae TaxID=34508 RepID=A0A4U5PH95_STECR|nr:hypothetical protein L596_010069 [Steinernema carpocapsae]
MQKTVKSQKSYDVLSHDKLQNLEWFKQHVAESGGWREEWQASESSTDEATLSFEASQRSRTSLKPLPEENGLLPGRWPTPSPRSDPPASKHGGRRRQVPKKSQQQDGATTSPRNSDPGTGREAHVKMPIVVQ